MCVVASVVFFFQAEDGIRDVAVTGVQTCALPIFPARRRCPARRRTVQEGAQGASTGRWGVAAFLELRRGVVGVIMHSEDRMSVRRSLIPLALAVCATAAAVSCGDPSPVGVDLRAPAYLQASRRAPLPTKGYGLVACAQTYDSVTQVIGPAGGLIAVGHHFLWVDSMALSDTVSIKIGR